MIHRQPVFERWLMGGAVLIDPVEQPGLIRLDGTAAVLWEVLSGAADGITDEALVETLATEYAVAPDSIRPDVDTAVNSLLDHGAARRDG